MSATEKTSATDSDQIDAKGEGDSIDSINKPIENSEDVTDAFNKVRIGSDTNTNKFYYNMQHPKRGKALIINNRSFDPKTQMGERTGTDVDAAALHQLFNNLRFEVTLYNNLTAANMLRAVTEVARMDHSSFDCFACAILSHGEDGVVYGVDGVIQLDVLMDPFKGDRCSSLVGKPKLFFVQACRGNQLDHGVEKHDGDDNEHSQRIPTEADFLICYSTVPGYFSWRNSTKGSWFVQALIKVFTECARQKDILSMMTRVNYHVAYEFQSNASKEFMNKKKQIPSIVSMLTKEVYFFPQSS